MLRMGIVGTGGIANAHANAASAVDGVELVVVADVDADAATAFASTHGVPSWYGGIEELTAAEQLDIVSVCHLGKRPRGRHLRAGRIRPGPGDSVRKAHQPERG